MLAAAVDPLEGFLVLQADQTVLGGDLLHHLHGQQVVINGHVGGVVDGRQFMLGGGDLVVLGLGGDAQLPQFFVQFLHELRNDGPDGAEVMLFQFLTLGGSGAEEGTAGKHNIQALIVVFLADEEIFLFGADGGGYRGTSLPKRCSTLQAWSLMACMERSSGVFLSRASPV